VLPVELRWRRRFSQHVEIGLAGHTRRGPQRYGTGIWGVEYEDEQLASWRYGRGFTGNFIVPEREDHARRDHPCISSERATESFESGIAKTVRWYIDQRPWWTAILERGYAPKRVGLSA
jgi:hypothetical protein